MKPRWRRYRHGSPEFLTAVTRLYREGSTTEAVRAERRGSYAEPESGAIAIGGLVAGVLRQMPKAPAKSATCDIKQTSQNVAGAIKKARKYWPF